MIAIAVPASRSSLARSHSVTSCPHRCNPTAAATPARPAPTTTTRMCPPPCPHLPGRPTVLRRVVGASPVGSAAAQRASLIAPGSPARRSRLARPGRLALIEASSRGHPLRVAGPLLRAALDVPPGNSHHYANHDLVVDGDPL